MENTLLGEQKIVKKVIISGASSGIGFETALELAIGGHEVIALARSADKLANLQQIVLGLSPEAKIYPLVFDIVSGNYDDLQVIIAKIWGGFDVLINNAGELINKPFVDTDVEDFANMYESNVLGHINMVKNVYGLMHKKAHIVNIGSMGGFAGSAKFGGLSAYSVSKAALHCLTECLAEELAAFEIRVNCLALGAAQTEMLEKAFPGFEAPVMAYEMGKYIADFALNGHKFYNGKILPVAGNGL
ncbi:MAG: SDR family NAD(P)-dependent oxidoreductase [Sphingobacteriales bacterium]|nr:MAG: SDR family NAD(P)-dependent oxidoreductase [Sphingobacteriales bacterium]TAF80450.1 MAG: SDR family NAD(P)-dependent oxidoreductase [Sphingobacteriales bacterium]